MAYVNEVITVKQRNPKARPGPERRRDTLDKGYGMLRVVWVNDQLQGNSYQRLLIEGGLRYVAVTVKKYLSRQMVLGKKKFDIVHVHWIYAFLYKAGKLRRCVQFIVFLVKLVILRVWGGKIVWTVHNLFNHESRERCIELLFHRFLLTVSSKIIVYSERAKGRTRTIMNVFKKGEDEWGVVRLVRSVYGSMRGQGPKIHESPSNE
ncbi:MAG: glycosyltransferase [Candidatus Omnitrophica bacterium]|nr:glycosyltransferase [Candidatus Omnitrophota bacterium]